MLSVESKSREKKRSRSVVVSSRVNLLMRMQHLETKEMDDHIITVIEYYVLYYVLYCILIIDMNGGVLNHVIIIYCSIHL